MRFITADVVIVLHDRTIGANELQGLARDKSLESVLARVENRASYGLLGDVYELAACYAACIAHGHAFMDANKRTAFLVMDTVLRANGIVIRYPSAKEAGDQIIRLVLGEMDELDLAAWLRGLAQA